MKRNLLYLVPKKYKCPICNDWHNWNFNKNLDSFNDTHHAILTCNLLNKSALHLYFDKNYCYYEIYRDSKITFRSKVLIKDIKEQRPKVIFGQKDIIIVELEFESYEYDKMINCKEEHCSSQEVSKEGYSESKNIIKEEKSMNNNLLNMNMEFGPNTDENIASTIMGIAVKYAESWRIYDKKKKEITDIGNMPIGNLPMFLMPTLELYEGDLIKEKIGIFLCY